MANQAEVATPKNAPHGELEPTVVREGSVGQNQTHPAKATDDNLTEERRQHYGEDDKFHGGEPLGTPFLEKVNDMDTPKNPTTLSRIRGSNSDQNPTTGYGRHMCA